ncbi:hypothetical protein [uncultured Aliiroseovarius sp.]|uniref:hypothetical protein n=1 Tax=uncultured Aliiroseovarius sp. TaxID=1658783 RepID=UPI00260D8235|nr:hypothetical protein [uncultured Aliiroseovarius sp.]
MLIIFDASTHELNEQPTSELGDLYSELLRASYRGHHLVVLGRHTCQWGLDNLQLSSREEAHLKHLKHQYTRKKQLRSLVDCSLTVCLGDDQLTETPERKYSIGHKAFLRSRIFDEALLLVENQKNDGDFFRTLFSASIWPNGLNGFHFRPEHGGGGDIVDGLNTYLDMRQVIVTIHDSDKKAPTSPPSETARKLERAAERQTFVGGVFELPARATENLIPPSILKKHQRRVCACYGEGAFNTLFDCLEPDGEYTAADCFWKFFDVKKGIDTDTLGAIASIEDQTWIREKLGTVGEEIPQVKGFGNGILRSFLDCNEAIKDFRDFIGRDCWKDHFESFAKETYEYFVAEKNRATS